MRRVGSLQTDEKARLGGAGLLVAGIVVAIAIATDGAVSRGINGVGALLWLGSTVLLLGALRGGARWWPTLGLAVAATVVLSFAVEPTSITSAVPGFAVGGAVVALVARRPVAWALTVPALWLPVHLLTAVLPAIIRASTGGEASVRTDPPPTAAVVPLLMIVAAGVAGWLVAWVRASRSGQSGAASRRA